MSLIKILNFFDFVEENTYVLPGLEDLRCFKNQTLNYHNIGPKMWVKLN